jgi:hypothetical protein
MKSDLREFTKAQKEQCPRAEKQGKVFRSDGKFDFLPAKDLFGVLLLGHR